MGVMALFSQEFGVSQYVIASCSLSRITHADLIARHQERSATLDRLQELLAQLKAAREVKGLSLADWTFDIADFRFELLPPMLG